MNETSPGPVFCVDSGSEVRILILHLCEVLHPYLCLRCTTRNWSNNSKITVNHYFICVTWHINIFYMLCPYCDVYCKDLYLKYKLLSYMLLYMVYLDYILSICVCNIRLKVSLQRYYCQCLIWDHDKQTQRDRWKQICVFHVI